MRITKFIVKRKVLTIGLIIIIILLPIALLLIRNARQADAAWFNDSYGYRQVFSFTHNADITSERAITFSLDTAELITAGLMQSDCDDTRFTDIDGKVLKYQLTGTCNNAATTYEVVFPSIANGLNSGYVYYGNPAAASASQNLTSVTALTPSGGDPAITDRAVEEKGTTPILYWNLDQGTSTTAEDQTQYENDGTFGASTAAPTWQNEDMCLFNGKCLFFDGSNDYVRKTYSSDTELDPGTASFTIAAWFKHSSSISGTDTIVARADGVNGIGYKLYYDATNGVCFGIDQTAGSFPVDSACTTTSYVDSQWHYIEGVKSGTSSITLYIDGKQIAQDASITSSSISGSSSTFYIGMDADGTSNPWTGFIDEVKYYNYAKTESQVKADFANRGSADSVSTSFGNTDPSQAASQGLVGYWKLDESSGNVSDSSGNGTTLTNNGTTTFVNGKFGNGSEHVPASSQHFSTASTITGVKSVSIWINPDNTTNYYISLTSSAYITSTSGTLSATGFTNPNIYVNGVSSSTVVADTWQLVTVTTDTSVDANQFYVGRQGSNYYDGTMDEVRIYNRTLSLPEIASLYNWTAPPIGQWRMDEGTGTSLNDTSGNGNTGTISNGPIWGPGKFGKALSFDNTDDSVNAGSATSFDNIPQVTISGWIYPKSLGENNRGKIMGKANDNTPTNGWTFNLTDATANSIAFAVGNGDGTTNVFKRGTANSIVFNQWTHVAVTWDGSDLSANIHIYINGVESTGGVEQNASGGRNSDSSEDLLIGNSADGSRTFDGRLDNLQIYNYVRSQKQILSDLNAGHPVVGTPVGAYTSYWNLDEGYGTTANDISTNLNSLTLSATSWTNSAKFGKGWNGTGSVWLSRADDSDFDFAATDDLSLSMWFKSDSATNPATNAEYLMTKATVTNTGTAGYAIYANTSGNIVFGIKDDGAWGASSPNTPAPDDTATSTADIYDNTWHHIVATKTGTSRIDLYVDGKLNASDTSLSATATLANAISLFVGDDDGDSGNAFNGDLDEIKIYRASLTADDVKVEYNQGKSQVFGALSTDSDGTTASFASGRESCVPGDTSTCDTPVGEWKLDENKGTTANDTSTNGNDLTLTNSPTYTIGKIGSAINFNGSNAQLTRTDDADFDFGAGGSFTLSAWIKHNTATVQEMILVKYNEAGYKLLMESDGDITCGIDYDSTWTPTDSVTSTAATYDDNNWHYISCVKNANTSLTLYIDGLSVGTPDTSLTNSTLANSDPLYIGIDADGTSNDWIGKIDQISIASYARTSSQVAWNYNRGGPVGLWKFDECSGGTANDSSGKGNNGTLTGTSGSNTSNGTCTVVDSATKWYNGAVGKYNSGLDFDGTDDYVVAANSDSINMVGDITMASWMKRDAIQKGTFIAKTNSGNWDYDFGIEDTTSKLLFYSDDVGNVYSNSAITDTNWHHVAVTRTASDGAIKFYIDGRLDTSTTAASGNMDANTFELWIGKDHTSSGLFSGMLDDVRLYSFALTTTQIKTLYNENAAVRFAPLTGTP